VSSLFLDRPRHFWSTYRWPILGLLAVVAMGLGYWGFSVAADGGASVSDRIYETLQLFPLESGDLADPVPWQIQVARILAPVVATYAAVSALTPIVQEQLARVRAGRSRRHILICGLGICGRMLAISYRDSGRRVVAIEADPENPAIAGCRQRGVVVIIGDASSEEALDDAGLRAAERVVAVSGDDGTNLAIAAQVRRADARLSNPLACHVQLSDPGLAAMLAREELTCGTGSVRMDYYSAVETGGLELMNRHWPSIDTRQSGTQPHVVIVGLGQMGRALLVEAARRWRQSDAGSRGAKIRVTVVERKASQHWLLLLVGHPGLEKVCEVETRDLDVDDPEFAKGLDVDLAGTAAVFVSLADDARGFTAAAVLRDAVGPGVPIAVRTTSFTDLDGLLGSGSASLNIETFPIYDFVCTPEVLVNARSERIAQAIHAGYLREERAKGHTPETNSSAVPWAALPDHLKESNREQAADLGTKLDMIACGLVPVTRWDEAPLELTEDEIELLAPHEHARWFKAKCAAGWVFGPTKDDERKTTPSLVPWDELSDEDQHRDRSAVREIPTLLQSAGYEVVRVGAR
jgi:voltage-gated potassium channel Kch